MNKALYELMDQMIEEVSSLTSEQLQEKFECHKNGSVGRIILDIYESGLFDWEEFLINSVTARHNGAVETDYWLGLIHSCRRDIGLTTAANDDNYALAA